MLHNGQSPIEIPLVGVDISQIVQWRGESSVKGRCLFEPLLRQLIFFLMEHPASCPEQELLIFWIVLQQLVHGDNARKIIVLPDAAQPGDQQSLARADFSRE